MKTFDAQRIVTDLRSDVILPCGKAGKCEICYKDHPPGSKFPIVSMRNSLFTGFNASTACVEQFTRFTQLHEDGLLWMQDSPIEIFLHHFAVDAAKGDVLIGGLGIGYSAKAIARKPQVKTVTVVEINPDVVKLVAPYTVKAQPKIKVVTADLWKFLKTTKLKFDFVFLDIWRSTGEYEFESTVQPLRKLAKRVLRPSGKVMCWGEEEMRGQVRLKRETRKLMLKRIVK